MSLIPLKALPSAEGQSWLDRYPLWQELKLQISRRWQAATQRERYAVMVALVLLLLTFFWMVLLAPAIKTLRTTPAQLAALDAQWLQMQAQANQVRRLAPAQTLSPTEMNTIVDAATKRLGADAKVTWVGDRATLQFNQQTGMALSAWLNEVRAGARMRAIESSMTRQGNAYSGTIVVVPPITGN